MVEITDLRKSYGDKHAVNGISFSVAEGEILGFLGPNGAGKSTTLNMITGSTRTHAVRVTALNHKARDYTMKNKPVIKPFFYYFSQYNYQ